MNKVKLILVVILLVLLYFAYTVLQDNSNKYHKYEHTIDSLSTQVKALDSVHHKQDSVIIIYKDSVVYMDKMIVEEKVKYVQIKNKYNEIRTLVANYTPNQLDSFFAKRYRY